jgi:hypothetical protein
MRRRVRSAIAATARRHPPVSSDAGVAAPEGNQVVRACRAASALRPSSWIRVFTERQPKGEQISQSLCSDVGEMASLT